MKIILDALLHIGPNTFLLQMHYENYLEVYNYTKHAAFLIIKEKMNNNLTEFQLNINNNLIHRDNLQLHINHLIDNSFIEILKNKKSYKLTQKALIELL